MDRPKIDLGEYLKAYPEVSLLGMDPQEHYYSIGRRLGYKAVEITDDLEAFQSMATQNSGVALSCKRYAWLSEKRDHFECFDGEYYLAENPDVAAAGVDPAGHYFSNGWREGRSPNAWFSVAFYLLTYPEISDADVEPLQHFFYFGRYEGRYATYRDWHADRISRQVENRIPSIWLHRDNSRFDVAQNLSLAIHIHCFFIDVFEGLIERLASVVPNHAEYFVSVVSEDARQLVAETLKSLNLKLGRVAVVPNRGRDIAPLFVTFAADLEKYDLCLHIHTKKSTEKMEIGERWLRSLMQNLLPSRQFVENTLGLLYSDPSIGLVGPVPYHEIKPFMVWGQNYTIARQILDRLGIQCNLQQNGLLAFPAGSFFWFRPEALKVLIQGGLSYDDFPEEPIPDDGTIAHAIERCLPIVAESLGFSYAEIQPVPFEAAYVPQRPVDISIVIPVYNAAEYIHQLIWSIVRRDCYNYSYEIIAVDNNSSDNSWFILKSLEKIVPELTVLKESRQGAGAARNAGLRVARGEFVTFVDADDLITPDAIGLLYDAMFVGGDDFVAEFVTSSLQTFGPDGLSVPVPYPDNGSFEFLSKENLVEKWHYWHAAMNDFGSCAKLYRKSFLDLNNIRFPEGLNFEDNYFIGKAMVYCQKVVVLNQTTYLYRKQNIGGTQSTKICASALRDQAKIVQMTIEDCDLLREDEFQRAYLKIFIDKLYGEAERMGMTPELSELLEDMPLLLRLLNK